MKKFLLLPFIALVLTSCTAEAVSPKNVARVANPSMMHSVYVGDDESDAIPVDVAPRDGFVDMLRENVFNKNYRTIEMEVYGEGVVDVLVPREMLDDIEAAVRQNPQATFTVTRVSDNIGAFAAAGYYPNGDLDEYNGGVFWRIK